MENLKFLQQEIQDSKKVNDQLLSFKIKGEEKTGDKELVAKAEEL